MKTTVTKDLLVDLYFGQQMSRKQIAQKIGCGSTTVLQWMKKFDIPRRTNGEALKGKPKTETHKAKLSESKKGNRNPNFGKRGKSHGKRCWYTCPDGKSVSMRSQWEVWYAEFLRENNMPFQYEPETFILSDGRAYTPDFYLISEGIYVEVKGWLTADHKERMKMFGEEQSCSLVLADKEYLTKLGIDLRQKWISTQPVSCCEQCSISYFKKSPKQVYCSAVCRNVAIRSNPAKPKEERRKRNYKGNQNGESNNGSILKVEQVIDIRKRFSEGKNLSQIAKETGATVGNISNIVHRKSWKDVKCLVSLKST
jgi:transposase